MTTEDIPSLTLRVLQNIQGELVGLRVDVQGVKTELQDVKAELKDVKAEVRGVKAEVHELRGDVQTLKDRFDHFLTFVGRDVQDLKTRVSALEQRRP